MRKVYRDLSRKVSNNHYDDFQIAISTLQKLTKILLFYIRYIQYHPDRHPNNDDAWFKFQKIYVAYSTLHDLTKLEHEREVINQDAMQTVSPEEARKAYEVEFGEYRGKYYGKGAIIGLPYSYSLQESLDRPKRVRDAFSFTMSRTQFSFFRSWFIKKEINLLLLLVEILCTWGAIVLGK